MRTKNTITSDQIRALGTEAAAAGDHAQVLICEIALDKHDPADGYDHLLIWTYISHADRRRIAELDAGLARDVCVDVIRHAGAQHDSNDSEGAAP
jgi:hypothetical protein